MANHANEHPPSRKQRWGKVKARLMMPIHAVDHSGNSNHRFSRAPHRPNDVESTVGDETYLGGELPDDPFSRGPVIVVGRPRTTSAPSLFFRKSYLRRKPLPPLPRNAGAETFLTPDNVDIPNPDLRDSPTDLSITSNYDSDPENSMEAHVFDSRVSSPRSDASFHTCPSADSDSEGAANRVNPNLSWTSDFPSYESTSKEWFHEWTDFGARRRTMESLWELTAEEAEHEASSIAEELHSKSPSDVPPALKCSATQFARAAAEELSPLSVTAASVAFDRRASCSLRRANSSPLLASRRRTVKERKVISCLGKAVDSRPPSYSSGQESVPSYRS